MFPCRSEASAGSPKVKGASGETGGTKPLVQVRPPSWEVENAVRSRWVNARPKPGKNSTTWFAELL